MNSLFLLLLLPINLSAQDLPPPAPEGFYSDYGPRNNPGYNWHGGLDYDGDLGDPVWAVESGTITSITISTITGTGGHALGIRGATANWFYLHLFANTFPSTVANWTAPRSRDSLSPFLCRA